MPKGNISKIVCPLKDISEYANTCYIRGKSSRPSALHCLGKKNYIHLSETNPSSSTSRKQSRLTAYCRHRATIRYALYTYTHVCPRYVSISDLAEIESATVGGIRKRKRERESTHDASLLKIISFYSTN